jgi:serine/threonine-protein kinase
MGDVIDEKTDIYSVGVMLFEMLTGRLPFEADSPVSVALKQIQSQAVRPTSINPDIPTGLEDITLRAMQKDSSMRYKSAAEMISDIEQFKQNPSIQFQYKYNDESDMAKDKKIKQAIDSTRREEPMPRRRRTPYIPILTGVTLAFVLAALAFVGLMFYYNNPFITVDEEPMPYLVGIKYETAVTQYEQFDIVLDDIDGKGYSREWGMGVIVDQNIKADLKVKLGSQVMVKVSLGPQRVELPNFAGRESRQAFAWLKENGLEYKEHKRYSEEIAVGSIIYTDPSKDTTLDAGTLVNVYVSMGPEQLPTEVPDVSGLPLSYAQDAMTEKMLIVSEFEEQFSDAPVGYVIGQEPPGGTMVNDGSSIKLIVSKGPDPQKSQSRVPIAVMLPEADHEIRVSAWVGNGTAASVVETVDATVPSNRYWTPEVYTSEVGEVLVKVYVDRKLFSEFTVVVDPPENTGGGYGDGVPIGGSVNDDDDDDTGYNGVNMNTIQ